jgi:hypothetical protein
MSCGFRVDHGMTRFFCGLGGRYNAEREENRISEAVITHSFHSASFAGDYQSPHFQYFAILSKTIEYTKDNHATQ